MSVRMNMFYNEPNCLPLEKEYQTYELNITSVVLDNIVRSNQSSLQFDKPQKQSIQ